MLKLNLLLLFLLTAASLSAQVKIAGHRGGYYEQFPESSFSLFQFLSEQFDGDTIIIEIDLRKSKNGTLYLLHDETLERTTTGSGKINERPDSYLSSLVLKAKTGETTDQCIPTFQETLNFIRTRNVNLMLDIKEPIHKEVLNLVREQKLESRVLVLTFRNEYSKLVAENYSNVLLSVLIETDKDLETFEQLPVHPGRRIAYINTNTPAALVGKLHKSKIFVMADVGEARNNANQPLTAAEYRSKVSQQQLDILITDYPIEARRAFVK